jgi:hypothetical protein
MEVICRPLALERLAANALSGSHAAGDENEVEPALGKSVSVDTSDAPRGAGNEGSPI